MNFKLLDEHYFRLSSQGYLFQREPRPRIFHEENLIYEVYPRAKRLIKVNHRLSDNDHPYPILIMLNHARMNRYEIVEKEKSKVKPKKQR